MNWSWSKPLADHMKSNPVLYSETLELSEDTVMPDLDTLGEIFPGTAHSLKTWGRTEGVLHLDPHWIGVRNQTPLHVDPRYPRYTHHLLLRVDDFVLRGMDEIESEPLVRGTYIVVDTHSPHQLKANSRDALWYVGVSIDADDPLPAAEVVPSLLAYATSVKLDHGLEL